jgi:hypothetical protein
MCCAGRRNFPASADVDSSVNVGIQKLARIWRAVLIPTGESGYGNVAASVQLGSQLDARRLDGLTYGTLAGS